MPSKKPNIFSYSHYRDYLADYLEHYAAPRKISHRSILKRAEIKNPSYLQQVCIGKRNLTSQSGAKLAKGLGLSKIESEFLVCLVQLDRTSDPNSSSKLLSKMEKLISASNREAKNDESIYSSWLYGVIWAFASVSNFEMSAKNISNKIGGIATPNEIGDAITFLEKNGYIKQNTTGSSYTQAEITFRPLNDRRRIEIQRNHQRFLDLAKLRISDHIEDREYQGLTIAISPGKMTETKKRLREFVRELSEDLSHDAEAEEIARIQCCAFWISGRDKKS